MLLKLLTVLCCYNALAEFLSLICFGTILFFHCVMFCKLPHEVLWRGSTTDFQIKPIHSKGMGRGECLKCRPGHKAQATKVARLGFPQPSWVRQLASPSPPSPSHHKPCNGHLQGSLLRGRAATETDPEIITGPECSCLGPDWNPTKSSFATPAVLTAPAPG